jgi:Tol biopolymer transport system component
MKTFHIATSWMILPLLCACATAAPAAASSQPSPQVLPAQLSPQVLPTAPSSTNDQTGQSLTKAPVLTGEAIYYGLRERLGEGYQDMGVFRYDLGQAALTQVAQQGWNLQDVSPDGAHLLLNQGSNLFGADNDGSEMMLITDAFFDSGSRGAAWKKDGSGVIYIRTGENGNAIVATNLEGAALQVMTASGDSPIELEALSPGGDIYWQKGSCGGEGICQREGVFRLKVDAGASELLEGMKHVRLSPDGKQITYSYENEAGKSSLALTGIDLATRTPISLPGDLLGDFSWSPDGVRIAAVRYDRSDYSGKVSGTRNFLVDPATPGTKELPESPGLLGGAAFSPDGSKLLLSSSAQASGEYGIKFQLIDLVSGGLLPSGAMEPEASQNFLLLTNQLWLGN